MHKSFYETCSDINAALVTESVPKMMLLHDFLSTHLCRLLKLPDVSFQTIFVHLNYPAPKCPNRLNSDYSFRVI